MRYLKRLVILSAVASLFVATLVTPAIAGAEGQFVSKINASRAASGKAPLEVYWDLADDARAQAAAMAAKGSIYHNSGLGGVTSGWTTLAENVGVGFDVNQLHQAFMDSAGHRSNILGDFNYVGVGVTVDDSGLLWVAVVFMKAAPGLNGGSSTTTVAPTTTTTTPVSIPTPLPKPSDPKPDPTTTTSQPGSTTTTPKSDDQSTPKPSEDVMVPYGDPRGPYAI